jgi:hypothetical protein
MMARAGAEPRRTTIHVYLRVIVDDGAVERQAARRRVDRQVIVDELAQLVECRATDSVAFVDGVERLEASKGPLVLYLTDSEMTER